MISYETVCGAAFTLGVVCLGSAVLAFIPASGLAVWLAGAGIAAIASVIVGPVATLLLLMLLRGILRALEQVITAAIERLDHWMDHPPEPQHGHEPVEPEDLDMDTDPLTDFQQQS